MFVTLNLYVNLIKGYVVLGLSGDEFHFDPNGDGPARYNIIHFKETSPGHFKWVRVGEYLEGILNINMTRKLNFLSVIIIINLCGSVGKDFVYHVCVREFKSGLK